MGVAEPGIAHTGRGDAGREPRRHRNGGDEAEAADEDPVLFRLRYLEEPRARAVIEAVSSAGSFLDGGGSRPMQKAALKLVDPDLMMQETRAIADVFRPKRQQMIDRLEQMGIRIDRQNGANVLAALTEAKRVMAELREGPMAELGLDLQQSFDASVFIQRAVRLVTGNLLIGVLLAVGVLWWFLRSIRGTVLIAIAIPVSLLATFVVLKLTGRSLNVISLAGLAFAVGMVLDAAIVVSENIVRLKERGAPPLHAALKATGQVKGALLASTATTVAIFLPVVFMREVEGQLFLTMEYVEGQPLAAKIPLDGLDADLAMASLVGIFFFKRFLLDEPVPPEMVERIVDDFIRTNAPG